MSEHQSKRQIRQYLGFIEWIHQETPDVKTYVVSKDSNFTFEAGQYIMFGFADKRRINKKINIPLSIASSPDEKTLRVTIKKNGGYTTEILEKLKIGDKVIITGPLGKVFNFSRLPTKKLIVLTGGSGIVPFMSLMRFITNKGLKDYKFTVLNGNKNFENIIFREELDYLSSKENIFVMNFLEKYDENWKGEKGFINEKKIIKYVNLDEDNTFLICGPPIMQYCMEQILQRLKIPKSRILKENWGFLKPDDRPKNC